MTSSSSIIFSLFLLFHSYQSIVQCRNLGRTDTKLSTYIIHVLPINLIDTSDSLESYYMSFLPTTIEGSTKAARFVYSYTEVFSGFAARLTEHEVDEMAKKEGFVRAYPDEIVPLLTTHTPTFLGLQSGTGGGIWNASSFGEGVIVGLLDTGITPGHPSFSDEGMPPPPKTWKGTCQFQGGCNNKLIGARAYWDDPTDTVGHGSHTAGTAAGSVVSDVDAFKLGTNVASGIAPKAHLAMYRVCDLAGCRTADILAGLDDSVKDSVDVLSLSIGGVSRPYQDDPIAIGSFAATQKGIIVVCAAGNNGPLGGTLSNEAPWILTVAATSIDRSFRSTVHLGNGKKFDGETLYQPTKFSGTFPLVFPGADDSSLSDCMTLATVNVVGKIVVCQSVGVVPKEKSQIVQLAGGVGMIHLTDKLDGYTIIAYDYVIPTVHVSYADSLDVVSYVKSASSPKASITFNGTVLGTSPSPTVASFSSRGPSQQSPGILKPDISAPGLNILAPWHQKVFGSKGKFGFNVMSGTSMATPHVSGIAALLKSLHPDWSPAAIKSAILTSSDVDDRDGNPIKDEQRKGASFYTMGAGHVNPSKAAEPGLVYDLGVDDYVGFLCGMGLQDGSLRTILRRSNASCSGVKNITEFNLNYPSITVPSLPRSTTVTRTVTNVGAAASKYTVEVDVPKGVVASVEPKILQFSKVNEKKTFTLTISSSGNKGRVTPGEGNLKWVSASGKVVVRSPIVIINNSQSSP